ncbi:MAG: hypothetical protein OEY52_17555, partial [Gammaproteobacteria bacterium]|nr:hypothetical protein [Gammaproteobacteria bacterium]
AMSWQPPDKPDMGTDILRITVQEHDRALFLAYPVGQKPAMQLGTVTAFKIDILDLDIESLLDFGGIEEIAFFWLKNHV